MSRAAYLQRLERERLAELERRGRARREARAVADGVSETVVLEQARGAAFSAPDCAARSRPYRRLTGLEWLGRKGRITPAQRRAGEGYGACFRLAAAEAAIPSTLGHEPGSGSGAPLLAVVARAERRLRAAERLAALRGRLGRQADLVQACDRICGEGLTPREAAGGEREAGRLEAVLRVALDLLAGD